MTFKMLSRRSISVRLAVFAVFWSFLILLIAGLVLSRLYRERVERAFDERLLVYAKDLAADMAVPGDFDHRDLGATGEPRFNLPLSGWYWQITGGAHVQDMRTSRSLVGLQLKRLVPDEPQRFGDIRKNYSSVSDDRVLRLVERDIDLGDDGRFVIAVAGPADEIESDVRSFTLSLGATFIVLGLALGLTTLLQIRFGLAPLALLRSRVEAVRRSEAARIEGDYPWDLAPLARELNLLIDSSRAILERARREVGNLAHALKTPLSVLLNEAEAAEGPLALKLREQTLLMKQRIDDYLARARASAIKGASLNVAEVEPVVAGLLRAFVKIHHDRKLTFDVAIAPQTRFRGEMQDLEDMIGNLLDNACKWAASTVALEACNDETGLVVTIEDDGPGLAENIRAEALKRGRRLDETKPGSGLGLSIVTDLAELYGGALSFEKSKLGGLKTRLDMPGYLDFHPQ